MMVKMFIRLHSHSIMTMARGVLERLADSRYYVDSVISESLARFDESQASIIKYYRQRLNPQYPPPPKSRKTTRTMRMRLISSSKYLAGISLALMWAQNNSFASFGFYLLATF
jgi:hypothetical protein